MKEKCCKNECENPTWPPLYHFNRCIRRSFGGEVETLSLINIFPLRF